MILLDKVFVNIYDISFNVYLLKVLVILSATYISTYKAINHKVNLMCFIENIIFNIFLAFICTFIKYKYNSLIAISFILVSITFVYYFQNRESYSFSMSLILNTIMLSFNYILFFSALFISFLIETIISLKNDFISLLLITMLYIILLSLFFSLRRFKNGISFLKYNIRNDYFNITILNISVGIIFLAILLNNFDFLSTSNFFISFIVFSIIMFITIKNSITLYYKHNLLVKELNETKNELNKKEQEVAKLEAENLEFIKTSHSIAHKQKALEYKIKNLTLNNNFNLEISKEFDLTNDLENISKDLSGNVQSATPSLSKTGIDKIDDMLEFLHSECVRNKIDFDLKIVGNIHYMTNHFVTIDELEILLADHIKDAIIAIKHSTNVNRTILVKLGLIDEVYSLFIYDSGIEFDIDTLLSLGSKPITTHDEDGGTGLGFMNTFDTLNKHSASLCIHEINAPLPDNYTKSINIKFDNLHKFEIKSYRKEDIKKSKLKGLFEII